MAQEYAPRKAKQDTEAEPLLNDEDQNFLERITSEEAPPPLPERPVVILDNGEKAVGKDAQVALMAGADAIPLPSSPPVEGDTKQDNVDHSKGQTGEAEKKKRDYWSYVPNLRFTGKGKAKEQMASDLQSVAAAVKSGSGDTTAEGDANTEAEKEQEDISSILDQLNLSAVNNRAFSFSKESQKLMAEFTQILKDIVNGVPTAYDDLEKLLTRSEGQLDKLFLAMPPFLQTLVKSLPAKMTSTLGPEFLAATSEKPGADAKYLNAESSKSTGKKKRSRIPSLKSLVGEKGAVAGMLRSILNFLKLRFPAVLTGTNVLMSLAVFLLLFVFWYCHKRGKETRLSKEKLAGESGESDYASDLDESTTLEKDRTVDPPIEIHDYPAIEEKPSAALETLPDVLNQSAPAEVPLPVEKK